MFLPYALDTHKNWVHIRDIPYSGRTHELKCPFCNNPLIAKKGKVLIHHFAHEANQSCKEWSGMADYIPPYEGYYIADLSRTQQRVLTEILQEHGDSPFNSQNLHGQTVKSLATKGFLNSIQVPHLYREPEYNTLSRRMLLTVAQLTPRAKAFAHQLTLTDYATFAEAQHQQAIQQLAQQESPQAQLALAMLHNEYQRWQDTHLYLLEIESDSGPFLKIGITTRPLEQRISEIRTFLRQHYLHVEIRPLFDIPQVPYLEGYFKSKFADHQLEIENATEYFKPFEQAYQELDALQHLITTGIPTPAPVPTKNPERPRFQATFWRKHAQKNAFRSLDDTFLFLINITNLATLEKFADWKLLPYGKQFEKLGPLEAGDVLEFDAAIVDGELKRPTKVVKLD